MLRFPRVLGRDLVQVDLQLVLPDDLDGVLVPSMSSTTTMLRLSHVLSIDLVGVDLQLVLRVEGLVEVAVYHLPLAVPHSEYVVALLWLPSRGGLLDLAWSEVEGGGGSSSRPSRPPVTQW